MQFLREPLDAVTRAARQQIGAVVEQANAIRKSVRTFHLSAEEAAQAEARIGEEALKLLNPENEELSATGQALKQLAATFAELRRNMEALNVTAAEVTAAESSAIADLVAGFDDANRRATLAITDPLALALEDFDRVAEQRLDDVKALGADTVLVERRNMLERQKIVERFAAETAAAVSGLPRVLESLTGFAGELQLGALSALSPDERYGVAASQFADISSRAAAGELAAMESFEGVARSFLEVSHGRYGSTAAYAGDFGRVVSALDKLSAQPQTNWQRLDATISEGNSESARLLRGLIDEVKRLRAEVRQAGTIKPARVA